MVICLTGNQPVLIFHRIPANTPSCVGFTRNWPEGMHVHFSTDPASHSGSQLERCLILSSPVPVWPCSSSSCRTPEDGQVDCYPASAELVLSAALAAVSYSSQVRVGLEQFKAFLLLYKSSPDAHTVCISFVWFTDKPCGWIQSGYKTKCSCDS